MFSRICLSLHRSANSATVHFSCDFDSLTVEDSGRTLGRFCGDWSDRLKLLRRVSSAERLSLVFVTDYLNEFPGFEAELRLVSGEYAASASDSMVSDISRLSFHSIPTHCTLHWIVTHSLELLSSTPVYCFTLLHSTPTQIHSAPLHITSLRYVPLNSISFHSIPLHSISFHSIPLHSTPFYSTPPCSKLFCPDCPITIPSMFCVCLLYVCSPVSCTCFKDTGNDSNYTQGQK